MASANSGSLRHVWGSTMDIEILTDVCGSQHITDNEYVSTFRQGRQGVRHRRVFRPESRAMV